MAAQTIASSAAASLALAKGSFVSGRSIRTVLPAATVSKRSSVVVRASDKPATTSRQTWFSSPQSLSYLDGTLPGDFGFDPLGLMDPESAGQFIDPKWLPYAELINGRWAMLGASGMIAPEILGKAGVIPADTGLVWFQSGVIPPLGSYDYWADGYSLFAVEIILLGFAEHRRAQDYYKPGYAGKEPFLGLEAILGGSGDPAYPGGPFFNFAGFGKDAASMKVLKTKEVKNSRLAMLAVLGYFMQGIFTGVGPFQNLLDHLADPVNNNILTNLKLH